MANNGGGENWKKGRNTLLSFTHGYTTYGFKPEMWQSTKMLKMCSLLICSGVTTDFFTYISKHLVKYTTDSSLCETD